MSIFAKRAGCLLMAVILAVFTAFAAMPVKASAASSIKYELSYSGDVVRLTFMPKSSSNSIYYTTNGSTPTRKSKLYSKPLSSRITITVRAGEFDKRGIRVATFKMTIMPRAQVPKIAEVKQDGKTFIKITSADEGAVIYYTLDGSLPNESAKRYTGAFACDAGTAVKARAYVKDRRASGVITHIVTKSKTNSTKSTSDDKSDSSAFSEDAQRILDIVNQRRSSMGRSQLKLSAELCEAADIRAKEISQKFDHTRPNGKGCFTVFEECGISYHGAAENIAGGQKTADRVMNEWLSSNTHRNNIEAKRFTKMGVGIYNYHGVIYWVQLFMY